MFLAEPVPPETPAMTMTLDQPAVLPLTSLAEEEAMFREAVRQFAESELAPRAARMDAEARMDPDIFPQLFELGLMGIEVPEELGGAGSSFFASIVVIEEVSRVDPAVGVLVDVQNTLINNCFLRYGSEDLQARYLPRLASEWIGAYCLSEAGSGSDAFALSCRASDEGDHYRLEGPKLWITNGGEASLFIVFANLDPAKGYRGITAFVVERDWDGVSIGKKEDKLGIRASSTVEVLFDGVKVPKENVLGEAGKGYKISIETLNEGRIGIGAQMVGLAQGALDHTVRYTQERQQFGKHLADFQAVQFQLARMRTDLEAARLMVYNAARLKTAGEDFLLEAAMAKLYASEAAQRISSQCVDLFGGYGFTKEYPVEKLFRDSKIGTIYEGTSNMQLNTIAKYMLR
jgi:alkylation response protein AidB-like acyl-CoA dehydrogenase